MGFFMSLILIIAIQYALSFVLGFIGIPVLFIDIIINLVLAFLFTFFNFARFAENKKEVLKSISFHLNFCIWFSVLMGMSVMNLMLF